MPLAGNFRHHGQQNICAGSVVEGSKFILEMQFWYSNDILKTQYFWKNSLWLSDAIWKHRSVSTWVQGTRSKSLLVRCNEIRAFFFLFLYFRWPTRIVHTAAGLPLMFPCTCSRRWQSSLFFFKMLRISSAVLVTLSLIGVFAGGEFTNINFVNACLCTLICMYGCGECYTYCILPKIYNEGIYRCVYIYIYMHRCAAERY